jgi:hypothetical protein
MMFYASLGSSSIGEALSGEWLHSCFVISTKKLFEISAHDCHNFRNLTGNVMYGPYFIFHGV